MIPIGGGNGGWSGCAPNPGGAATNNQDLVDQLKLPQKKDFDNYHAVAYHPDASDIWIMGGATRRDAAERDARLLCGINCCSRAVPTKPLPRPVPWPSVG